MSVKNQFVGSADSTPWSASNASAAAASRPSVESAPRQASVMRAAVTNPRGSASSPSRESALSPSSVVASPGWANTTSSRLRVKRSGRYPYRKSDGARSSFHVALMDSVSSARVTATSRFFFSLDNTAARRGSYPAGTEPPTCPCSMRSARSSPPNSVPRSARFGQTSCWTAGSHTYRQWFPAAPAGVVSVTACSTGPTCASESASICIERT